MKWLIGSTLVIATLVGGVLFLNRHQDAEALQASDFVAGNIMSDNVMTNKDSMSVSQIQSFLNSKVPTCDTQGLQTSEFGGRDINGDGGNNVLDVVALVNQKPRQIFQLHL